MSKEPPPALLDLEERAWKEFRTVLVLGKVPRAVWWRPMPGMPGVLAAGNFDQAREALEEMTATSSAAAPPS